MFELPVDAHDQFHGVKVDRRVPGFCGARAVLAEHDAVVLRHVDNFEQVADDATKDDALLAPVPEEMLFELRCACLLYTSPSPRDRQKSRMPSSA